MGRDSGKTPPRSPLQEETKSAALSLAHFKGLPQPPSPAPTPPSVGRAVTFLDTHSWSRPLPAATLPPPSTETAAQAAASCNSSHRGRGPDETAQQATWEPGQGQDPLGTAPLHLPSPQPADLSPPCLPSSICAQVPAHCWECPSFSCAPRVHTAIPGLDRCGRPRKDPWGI